MTPRFVLAIVFAILAVQPSPSSAALHKLEEEFIKQCNETSLANYFRFLAGSTHTAGSARDFATAQWVKQQWQSLGWFDSVEIQELTALIPAPVTARIEQGLWSATLSEDIVPGDADTDSWERNHTFAGYSPSGDVTAPLVYVNYARVEDFDWLVSQGIKLRGLIGLARYGHIFRGLKAKHAQEYGLIGLIVYSDPQDDGFKQGPVYPNGPWRPESSVQRGSYQFLSLCSGDQGQYMRAEEDPCGYAPSELMPSIPIQPISYRDGLPLLMSMTAGPQPPTDWVGGLPAPYAVGPSTAPVRLFVHNKQGPGPIWNVLGTIQGTDPDPRIAEQMLVIGVHRDAWVAGGVDPSSSSAVMLETIRALGWTFSTKGWRPRRTIVFASWDGEELGLFGSVHYGETAAGNLTKKAIAYINLDGSDGRNFTVGASPHMREFVRSVAAEIKDPFSDKQLSEAWNGNVDRLGSGSDFTVFLDHLGISSIYPSFDGPYGVYHSTMDSLMWYELYGDPGYKSAKALAQFLGLLIMRLGNSWTLPYNLPDYASEIQNYINEAQELANKKGMMVDHWADLQDAAVAFSESAQIVDKARRQAQNDLTVLPTPMYELNEKLRAVEQQFLDPVGLPRRKWFKHTLVAPGLTTGYAADVLPGLKQAIRDGNQPEASREAARAAVYIHKAAMYLSAPQYSVNTVALVLLLLLSLVVFAAGIIFAVRCLAVGGGKNYGGKANKEEEMAMISSGGTGSESHSHSPALPATSGTEISRSAEVKLDALVAATKVGSPSESSSISAATPAAAPRSSEAQSEL